MQGYFYRQPHQWPEALEARLADLWAQGVSAALIGEQLGKTRNAVIGKVDRLGLPMRQTVKAQSGWCQPPSQLGRKRQRKTTPETTTRPDGGIIDDAAIPFEQRKTLLELTPSCCKWPVGDPAQEGFFFCGGVAEIDRPFCPAHAKRAYA